VSKASLTHRLLHHRGIDYSGFAQVAANEPYGPVVLATNLPVPTVARLSEVLADLPGVDLEVQPIRDYPQGALGSHLIGYVGAITQDEFERRQIRRATRPTT
jgi:cell division protein FtsI/penicillin-binding protein 2